jgi:hypothetical protein
MISIGSAVQIPANEDAFWLPSPAGRDAARREWRKLPREATERLILVMPGLVPGIHAFLSEIP